MQPERESVFLDNFDSFSLHPFVKGRCWCPKEIRTLSDIFCLALLSYRLDEEAQKRADAENNLVAFRKVNVHHSGPR